jgi:SAM-dependent methyltransferase
VLDVGCGTGLCFPWIQAHIGPSGRLIAVEPSREMLDKAMQRAAQYGWDNVIAINSTAADLDMPMLADAVLFCATHDVLHSPRALANVFQHLLPLRGWQPLAASGPGRGCGGSFAGFDRLWNNLRTYCPKLRIRTVAWGTAYLATGTAARHTSRALPITG